MKQVLFATTALVATAGMAAADVTFGGYGRFGVYYNEAATDSRTGAADTAIESRFRLQIDASAESDAGVAFGARVRVELEERDEKNAAAPFAGESVNEFSGVRLFARSGGLEVGVGNIFGALEYMPGMYPIDLGLTGHNYDYTAYAFGGDAWQSGGAGSAGKNGVEVIYSAGDFSMHVSASDIAAGSRLAAHAAYKFSGWTVALGLQDSDNATDTELAFSIGGSLGAADVTLAYADNGTNGDHIVLAGRFDVGASTDVEVYFADADKWADTSYGVDFNHNLGGGTSLRGGISTGGSNGDNISADFGVRFNF